MNWKAAWYTVLMVALFCACVVTLIYALCKLICALCKLCSSL